MGRRTGKNTKQCWIGASCPSLKEKGKQDFKFLKALTCSGYTLPFISATVFLEITGGKFWASIFKLTIIFVPLAAILAIISASSIVIQAVGIFFTPMKHDINIYIYEWECHT